MVVDIFSQRLEAVLFEYNWMHWRWDPLHTVGNSRNCHRSFLMEQKQINRSWLDPISIWPCQLYINTRQDANVRKGNICILYKIEESRLPTNKCKTHCYILVPWQISVHKFIAVFTKDGAGSHHGHTLEYSELKVPSEVSQDPRSVRLWFLMR